MDDDLAQIFQKIVASLAQTKLYFMHSSVILKLFAHSYVLILTPGFAEYVNLNK